jgi:hypothetical protein
MSGCGSTSDPQNGPAKGTGVAPLLYWFTAICGLAGLTVIRFDEPRHIVPLWFGSVVGIALGQIVALLRVRVWAILTMSFGAIWFIGPVLYDVITMRFGGGDAFETAVLALLPAAVCGYASLTERGGLLAFWYPAMLWMLVILDGPGSVSTRTALPFVIGLAALFVAFLRARETRRVALWRTYGSARLATSLERTVLRESPLRGLSQLAWTGGVGAGALMLAAWIAPLLWQKEHARHEQTLVLPQRTPLDAESGLPCCHAQIERERVREYISLAHGRDVPVPNDPRCVSCQQRAPMETADWSYAGTPGAGLSGSVGSDRWDTSGYASSTTYGGGGSWSSGNDYPPTPSYSPTPTYTPPLPTEPAIKPAPLEPEPAPITTPQPPSHDTELAKPPSKPVSAPIAAQVSPPPAKVPEHLEAAPAPASAPLPWRWLLGVGPVGLVLHLLSRALRRRLTLRHLERPFWSEPVDQRISNHWQRMLVGLRDAGIRPSLTEQPQTFARRIGIDGMKACATILERVRHGVRVDADDLATMDTAATSVYRTSRARAGLVGRIAGSVRWPLV